MFKPPPKNTMTWVESIKENSVSQNHSVIANSMSNIPKSIH